MPDPEPRGRSALARLTGIDPQVFAERCWGRDLHLARAADAASGFADLFSLEAAEELVSHRGLRTPFLRMVRDGTAVPRSRFTSSGGVGATIDDQVDDARVRELFSAGATVVFQGLHRTWRPVGDFVRDLATEIAHPVQANCYVTPPESRGFDDHYDVHDVFVVQVHGRKEWSVHDPVIRHPLRDQPWDKQREAVRRAAAGEARLVTTVEPGDCLYLPRGFIHSARALGEVSAHLTLGVHPWTGHDLGRSFLELALTQLAEREQIRGSLTMGTTVGSTDSVETVRAALQTIIAEVSADGIRAVMAEKARNSMRAAPVSVFDPVPADGVHA